MREPWGKGNCPVLVASAYKRAWLDVPKDHKPTDLRPGLSDHPDYEAAKRGGDMDAAFRVVKSSMDRLYITRMKMMLATLRERGIENPILVAPYKQHSQNMLARAAAVYLGKELGLEVDTNILETDKVSRKELSKLGRIFTPATFEGTSKKGRWYIGVDDNMISGSTFADLRGHLVGQGSRFAFACALATPDGHNTNLNVSPEQVLLLKSGLSESIRGWMKNVVGISVESLTKFEGDVLLKREGHRELISHVH